MGGRKRKSETIPTKGKGKKVKKNGDGKEKEGEGKDGGWDCKERRGNNCDQINRTLFLKSVIITKS